MSAIEETLEVYVNPVGDVCIAQRDMNEDCFISIKPEDVDMLIYWLQQRRTEAIEMRMQFSEEGPFTD